MSGEDRSTSKFTNGLVTGALYGDEGTADDDLSEAPETWGVNLPPCPLSGVVILCPAPKIKINNHNFHFCVFLFIIFLN